MPHNISAILLKGTFNTQKAKEFDLLPIDLGFGISMFHINHYYSAYWQAKLNTTGYLDTNTTQYLLYPSERVLSILMEKITATDKPLFAIIATDYFGGIGTQAANVYLKDTIVDTNITTINEALAYFGVTRTKKKDEFDTVGLSKHRATPDYLDKYVDLAEELGV